MSQSLSSTIAGIKRNQFLVIGRAGMDLFPDPPGTANENATEMKVAIGGSSANIAIACRPSPYACEAIPADSLASPSAFLLSSHQHDSHQ